MGRRSGFEGFLRATVRAAAASERERQRDIRSRATQARQIERHQRMAMAQLNREDRAMQKEAKAQYLADRTGETDDMNAELQDRMQELQSILAHTLSTDDRIDFDTLRPSTKFERFETPPALAPSQAPRAPSVPPPLASWRKLIPGAATRHQATLAQLAREHEAEVFRCWRRPKTEPLLRVVPTQN